jgi:sortase (surface protein transpeptidase)
MRKLKFAYSKVTTKRLLPRLLGILAVLVLLVGASIGFYDWHANTNATNQAKKAVADANRGVDNGTPSTTPVSNNAFNNYKVGPNQPRYIFIPKLNVKAIVLSLGTTSSNQLQAPPNIYEAGWYNRSSLPGQAGAMLITGHSGHVPGVLSNGIFYGLKTLAAGDTIQIQRGDGTIFTYKVIRSQVYSSTNVDMKAALIPINPKKPGVNLISCTGDVIAGTNQLNQRVVVFAEQQP